MKITNPLTARFDRYFQNRHDHRTEAMRSYLRNYHRLVEEIPAYVPSVFVHREKSLGQFVHLVVWTLGIPIVIPPTDLVSLVGVDLNLGGACVFGTMAPVDLLRDLKDYVQRLDTNRCPGIALISPDNCSSNCVLDRVQDQLKPVNGDLIAVDVIPGF